MGEHLNDKIKLTIPDNEYWKKQIKCQDACPVGTDSRGYVVAIAEGRYLDAYKIARGPNPFSSICGRICGAPCESSCRRGSVDNPVAIRALKRYVTEQHGVEAVDPGETIKYSFARRDDSNPKAGTKVAVIGGGVGGFTAAHDLALLGYDVTVFEAGEKAGGMLLTGVPVYRLPRDVVQKEIDAILSLGVKLKTNTTIGKDITIPDLKKEGFEAILIAAGLQKSRMINIEGGDANGVIQGIEYLKEVNLGGAVEIGDKVVVIGGGNVAFDVARTAVRSDLVKADLHEAVDVARSAVRTGGAEVHLVCLESIEEMPADDIEIIEGVEEGVILHASRGPARIKVEGGKVTGLETSVVKSVFDKEGRFNPVFDEKPGETIEADSVIFAVGQSADFNFLNNYKEYDGEGSPVIKVDKETMQTNVPYLFACGDIAEGAGLFIDAVASGQKAAVSIDKFIRGKGAAAEEESVSFEVLEDYSTAVRSMPDGYFQKNRSNPEVIDIETRSKTHDYIEINYKEPVAQGQGDRCLKCNINTIFAGDLCILCGGCVDVCPMKCLELVKISDLDLTGDMEKLINNYYGIDIKKIIAEAGESSLDELGSVMIKNEELCIRCGFCSKRCPTGAVQMEKFSTGKECCPS
jgi:NADPH-dependent glutamate synthase beta subunit-like oxidoreductase